MPTAIEKIRAELDRTLEQAEEITTREDFNPEDEAYKAVKSRADELTVGYRELVAWEQRRAESDKLGQNLRSAESGKRQERETKDENLSPGELFVRSDAYSLYSHRGSTPRFGIDGNHVLTRALPASTTTWADALTTPPPRDITAPLAPTPLLDLIPAIPWSSGVVNYVEYVRAAGGAGVVTEGTAKPSGEWTPVGSQKTMKKIAVYTEATRELLEDGPAVRQKIDSLLVNDVRRQAEAEAATALLGAVLPTAEGADLLSAIRVGIGTVQAAGFQPNAVLLNPADWADLDIAIFGATLNGPTTGQSFWGLRPISSPTQPAGVATVGDFSSAMERYVRTRIEVYITDSHAGRFVENIFTILAETRELTAVVRPSAAVECSKEVTLP